MDAYNKLSAKEVKIQGANRTSIVYLIEKKKKKKKQYVRLGLLIRRFEVYIL